MEQIISIEDIMKKIALENDCSGKTIDGYDLIGCSPSVKLEYIDDGTWEACLTYNLLDSKECAYCSTKHGILHTSFQATSALKALEKLDAFCKDQRNIGGIVCDVL